MNQRFLMKRREFLKACAATAAASAISAHGGAITDDNTIAREEVVAAAGHDSSALGSVRPIVGTGWHGHMFPGAVAPFGLVQLSPDTSGMHEPEWNNKWDITSWDHCSGYHYGDNVLMGFSHTHLQGTGASDLGDVLLMPLVEGRNWSWNPGVPGEEAEAQMEAIGANSGWVMSPEESGYWSHFSNDQEAASPGHYQVHLQTPDVQAELTATTRCGMHRYKFPTSPVSSKHGVMLDLVHGIGCKVYAAGLNMESETRISGHRFTHGWATDKQVFFVIEFSRPIVSVQAKVDGTVQTMSAGQSVSGKDVQAIFTRSSNEEPLMIRVGLSCTSIDGARKNLAAEIPHWNFDKVRQETQDLWSKALSLLDANISDAALRQTFWTGAYHGLVAPATFNDLDGTYRGQDQKNHPNPGFVKYTSISIWDIYRGEFPFIMLLQPHRTRDIIETLIADYRELDQHSLPVWPLWGNETWTMTGFHVVGMIAGAYVRGFRDFDVESAYAAMRDTAMVGATANNNRELQEQFRQLGYVAAGDRNQSVSRTLDFSYDYWCVGAMAELLGKHSDAATFYKLGQNYKNIFDPKTGFMRGKTKNGQWLEPFRPDQEIWADYTESDAWQATFNVMHDVNGLIDLYGGDDAFMAKLDALFAAPSNVLSSPPDISGMVGQDAQGNEPSNHIPYLYSFAGAPWKTQACVRKVTKLYNNKPAGIPGNDDCGQISSWLVFAALGFYPVNAATGVYVIGSPLVNRASIHNPAKHTTFTILADNNSDENMYIQNVELNSKRLSRSWLTHDEIMAGGELHFRMGNRPNKEWGSAPKDRPPSGLLSSRHLRG